MLIKTIISLGSNIGDSQKNIDNCIKSLEESENIEIIKTSSMYKTSPMYNLDQNDFVNCVIEVLTSFSPLELLEYSQSVEKKMGRELFTESNQPRKIDIDILTYGDEKIEDRKLKVPHPKISDRKFVLVPLIEINPNFIVPGFSLNVSEMLKKIEKNNDKVCII